MLQRILMNLISQLKSAWEKIVAVLKTDVVVALKQFWSKSKGVFVNEEKPASTSTSESQSIKSRPQSKKKALKKN